MMPSADTKSVGRIYSAGIVCGRLQCSSRQRRTSFSWQCRTCFSVRLHGVVTRVGRISEGSSIATRHNLQRISVSYDDEFRSSRSVAIGLHRRYKDVVNRGISNNLKEFISAGVTAYAVGCTDEGLRKELMSVGEIDEVSSEPYGGSMPIGLKSKLSTEEVEECILWISLVFLTILCSPPPTVVRWSTAPAVSADAQIQWRGFCALIANAYYLQGMAWIPVKTLQMEQLAVGGYAEEQSLIADRMRLVFATLEMICPQWPKR